MTRSELGFFFFFFFFPIFSMLLQKWQSISRGFSQIWLQRQIEKQGMCQTVALAIYIKKKYLKAKEEELWKLKYFNHAKI